MKTKFSATLCMAIITSLTISAQTRTDKLTATPPTKVEQFLVTKGRLVVKNFYTIGTVTGLGGKVSFEVVVLADPQNERDHTKGFRVEVQESGRLERSHTSFLDSDEVDDLAKALTYMTETSAKWTANPPAMTTSSTGAILPAPYREVGFSTKDE